jgi:nicotinamide-nucleotide amidase
MIIELISIGDELLKGITINTNAAYLSCHLQRNGYTVARQTTLSDERASLSLGLKEALQRADLIIVTGGLGPTLDDHTREIAALLFHSDFRFDQTVAEDLKRRFGDALISMQDQSSVPRKAQVLLNRVGTAPGLVLSEGGKTLILMPGVPKEMEPMFLEQMLPLIQKQWPIKAICAAVQLFFYIVYESLLDPHLRELSERYPAVDAGIYPAHGILSVTLLSSDPEQLAAFQKELISRFGNYQYFAPSGRIEEALHSWFVHHKKTLSFAESCTGGMLASHITALSGASDYFLGSFVVYSNAMKHKILGVSQETLNTQGAVSEEVVREMWEGVCAKSNADFAIAVSGISGPTGGTAEKPVGTVCAAIGERGKRPDVGTFLAKGNRQTITLSTTHFLLGALLRKVEKGIPAFPLLLS